MKIIKINEGPRLRVSPRHGGTRRLIVTGSAVGASLRGRRRSYLKNRDYNHPIIPDFFDFHGKTFILLK
jgi:hypothetical protein